MNRKWIFNYVNFLHVFQCCRITVTVIHTETVALQVFRCADIPVPSEILGLLKLMLTLPLTSNGILNTNKLC